MLMPIYLTVDCRLVAEQDLNYNVMSLFGPLVPLLKFWLFFFIEAKKKSDHTISENYDYIFFTRKVLVDMINELLSINIKKKN